MAILTDHLSAESHRVFAEDWCPVIDDRFENRATCLVTLILIYFSENRITILFQITGSSLFVYIIIFWSISSNIFVCFPATMTRVNPKPTQNRFFLGHTLTVTFSEKFQNFHLQAKIVIFGENHKNDKKNEFWDLNLFTLSIIVHFFH